MDAVVLAGGLGTRLRTVLSDGTPKPMAPIGGKPFLELLLNRLAESGFSRVVLSVGYKYECIRNHFGNSFSGMSLNYVIEKTPLGTGGAIRLAMDKCSGDYLIVFNGDTYLKVDIKALEKQWENSKKKL